MRIATWNVNSIRTRLDHLVQWLETDPIDVVCLQETKVVDAQFPLAALQALGYHCAVFGQKSYNGVAILSRGELQAVKRGFSAVLGTSEAGHSVEWDDQKRVISGQYNGITIVNVYVPNGSSIGSDKYEYKLGWLTHFAQYLQQLLQQNDRVQICGDFNIAPDDRDIHNPADKETHIMASAAEREVLQSILDLGFVDAFRHLHPEGGQFTWWDYRAASFRRNLGWRIDHHYVSPALLPQVLTCKIDRLPRTWEKPSDHTPVILELELELESGFS